MTEPFPFFGYEPVQQLIDLVENSKDSLIVSICGGSCSGKTILANYLSSLGVGKSLLMDNFYRRIPDIEEYLPGIPAFDSPHAFELDRLSRTLKDIKNGIQVETPIYNYYRTEEGRDSQRMGTFVPSRVTFLDGILSYCEEVRHHVDYAIFLERSDDKRKKARIAKDVAERGVSIGRSIEIYSKMTCPLYEKYVLPQKQVAHFLLINEP